MEKRTKDGLFIDGEIQKSIHSERQKWRNILKCILQAILFCARSSLAIQMIKLELQMLVSSLILWK
jgi:hypothetical protein